MFKHQYGPADTKKIFRIVQPVLSNARHGRSELQPLRTTNQDLATENQSSICFTMMRLRNSPFSLVLLFSGDLLSCPILFLLRKATNLSTCCRAWPTAMD